MTFDLGALKAYIGGLLASTAFATTVAAWLIGGFEALLGIDIPPDLEGYFVMAVGFALGWLAIYFTSNQLGKAK